MKMVSCLPLPVIVIADLPAETFTQAQKPPECSSECLRDAGCSRQRRTCPFRQSPFRRKALTVFDISRSHQLAWMSGFGGTRSPFARDIKQSNVPGSQDLGRSAPLRKTGAPCGIRTHAAARRGRARARSNRVALLGRYLHARIGRVGSLARESTG